MPGPNTSGVPDTNDYMLGRGSLFASVLDTDGKPTSWRDLGNSPEFSLNVEKETLEHQSSRSGLKVTDKEVVLSQSVGYSFQLDEINNENMSLFFSGSKATHANPAVAGVSGVVLASAVELGMWYDLADSTGERLYDVDNANLTLQADPSGSPVSLVLNTDYEIDAELGRIRIKVEAANIAEGDELGFDYAADATATAQVAQVSALTETSVTIALKFIGENPADNGSRYEVQIQKTAILAEGDFALISDDWTTMTFTGSAERNDAYSPASGEQFMRVRTLN